MNALASILWYTVPVVYCLSMAYTVTAQPSLGEENRRIIERQEERMKSVAETHERDKGEIERRMEQIETWIFYLFLASGASPVIVGFDKAGYWLKKRNGKNGA